MELQIDLAFFAGDDLIARGVVCCGSSETVAEIEGSSEHRFEVTSRFEQPACPVEISCFCQGNRLYKASLRVGVHTSDDWESIDLARIHTLGFWCREIA
jgi:hypothetical protein